MLKIGITGGKGGTGKSTVSILLANKLVKEGKKLFSAIVMSSVLMTTYF